jgi:hypothetical protein
MVSLRFVAVCLLIIFSLASYCECASMRSENDHLMMMRMTMSEKNSFKMRRQDCTDCCGPIQRGGCEGCECA